MEAFHGSDDNNDYFDMKFAIFHPSGRFFATVSRNDFNTVSIWQNDMPEQFPLSYPGQKVVQPSQLKCKIETAFRTRWKETFSWMHEKSSCAGCFRKSRFYKHFENI